MVAITLVAGSIGAAGGWQLGNNQERAYLTPMYDRAAHDATVYKQNVQSLESELSGLNDKVQQTVGDLDNPTFVLWNKCGSGDCRLSPGAEFVGSVPDTFTYYVSFTATVPVTVWIMSTDDFVCWETHQCPWQGVG